jgi:hypothetical protein
LARLTSVLSMNAAISSSVVLASRLSDDIAVFALILFSVQMFALFPILRYRLQVRYLRKLYHSSYNQCQGWPHSGSGRSNAVSLRDIHLSRCITIYNGDIYLRDHTALGQLPSASGSNMGPEIQKVYVVLCLDGRRADLTPFAVRLEEHGMKQYQKLI